MPPKGAKKPELSDQTMKVIDKTVKKEVKDALKTEMEVKVATFGKTDTGISVYNSGTCFQVLSPYSAFTTILQGLGQGNRIGNKIRIKKCMFNYTLNPLPYNDVTNIEPMPALVKLWIFWDKINPTIPAATSGALPGFFQDGSSSSVPSSSSFDLTRVVNSDSYVLLTSKVHKVGFEAFVGTPGGVLAEGYRANNDFNLFINGSIDITKYMPKTIDWNDNATNPSSRAIQLMIEAMPYDTSSGAGEFPVNLEYTITTEFTDA